MAHLSSLGSPIKRDWVLDGGIIFIKLILLGPLRFPLLEELCIPDVKLLTNIG